MPVRADHDFGHLADILVRHTRMKKIAHGVDENHPAGAPFQGFSQFFGHQTQIKSALVWMSGNAAKALGECLGVAMRASGTDLRAPANRVPGCVSPLYFRIVRHTAMFSSPDDCGGIA